MNNGLQSSGLIGIFAPKWLLLVSNNKGQLTAGCRHAAPCNLNERAQGIEELAGLQPRQQFTKASTLERRSADCAKRYPPTNSYERFGC